ncbi:MAG TPA: type II secretion system protein [Verrucomicrobiae bacterium]|nr:type II secretion system protein [Verrucomicrobiae bacterium]
MRVGPPTEARRLRTAGFTIIETMIVLVVTGSLFVIIAATLTGRQNEAEFVHAIQSVQSQLQQAIDQVSAGFFPTVNLTCSAGASSLTFAPNPNQQGANDQCVFLGSVIQFKVQNTSPERYRIYTIAGERGPGIGPTSPFQNVTPTVMGIAATGDYASYSTAKPLQYGLTTKWMRGDGINGAQIGAFGVLMEPGGFATSGGYNSGAQPVDLVPLPGTGLSQPINLAVGAIESRLRDATLTADAPINPDNGVLICFASAGTNQSGLITIGSLGRQLVVKLDIKSNTSCS